MIHNKKAFEPITLTIGLVMLIVLVVFVFGNKGDTPIDSNTKVTVECDVVVHQPIFQEDKIKSYSCDSKSGCGFWDSLGIFTEEGNVRLVDNNKVLDKKQYKLTSIIHETDTVTLKGCTYDSRVKIRLTDEEDNLLDEKEVTIK